MQLLCSVLLVAIAIVVFIQVSLQAGRGILRDGVVGSGAGGGDFNLIQHHKVIIVFFLCWSSLGRCCSGAVRGRLLGISLQSKEVKIDRYGKVQNKCVPTVQKLP